MIASEEACASIRLRACERNPSKMSDRNAAQTKAASLKFQSILDAFEAEVTAQETKSRQVKDDDADGSTTQPPTSADASHTSSASSAPPSLSLFNNLTSADDSTESRDMLSPQAAPERSSSVVLSPPQPRRAAAAAATRSEQEHTEIDDVDDGDNDAEVEPAADQAVGNEQVLPESRQDLLRLRRLEIALRDANNFASDTRIIDWHRLRQLRQPLHNRDVILCFVRCRYIVARAWARLAGDSQQSIESLVRSQMGCTYFVQMTQFFQQMSKLVASQRYVSKSQLSELDFQHRRAASFFESGLRVASEVLPSRPIGATRDTDDSEQSRRLLHNIAFLPAVLVAEACAQPGALRLEAQPHWSLSEQLQGPVASAVNAALSEMKVWHSRHLRVAPIDLTRVLVNEHSLPRFAEWVALLAARERLAFSRRPVPNYISELINLRTAQARKWLQDFLQV